MPEAVRRDAADLDGWMAALVDELADSPEERHKRAAAVLESLSRPSSRDPLDRRIGQPRPPDGG